LIVSINHVHQTTGKRARGVSPDSMPSSRHSFYSPSVAHVL